MSIEDYDRFTDVIEGGVGSLGGVGYDEYQRVVHEPTDDGIVFQFSCQGCGRSKNALVEWAELIALNNNVDPEVLSRAAPRAMKESVSWGYRPVDGAFFPKIICSECTQKRQMPISLRLEDHEIAKHIRSGLTSGHLQMPFYQQVDTLCKQLYQRGLRLR